TLERAKAAAPADPKTYENLGVVELRLNRKEAARDDLRRALALNDKLPISWNTLVVALYNIGLVAAEAGRIPQARVALERFVATAPAARWGGEIAKARQMLARM